MPGNTSPATGPLIVVTGGGSGGHITPVLAVADALKRTQPDCRVVYIGQRGDKLGDIASGHTAIDHAYTVSAGKFRRYHGLGWRQLLKVRTMLLNVRDAFRVAVGIVQSMLLLRRLRPGVVFIKGGFVGVPVGLAAAWLGIPYVTHDSDALPGLANRIVARWARVHAVALPKEVYAYPRDKTVTVGVPIAAQFQSVDAAALRAARERVGLPQESQVVLVAGGGLGAQSVNAAVAQCLPGLLQEYPTLVVVQQAGRAHERQICLQYDRSLSESQRSRVHVLGFVTNMYDYMAAADVVVSRAGGTNLAELEVLQKPCIIVPNPYLTGGHQLSNARVLAERDAIVLVEESAMQRDPAVLAQAIRDILGDKQRQQELRDAIGQFAAPNASDTLAHMLLDMCANGQHNAVTSEA